VSDPPPAAPPTGLPARAWPDGRKLAVFLFTTAVGAAGLSALANATIPKAPGEQQPALIAAFTVLYGMPPLLAALAVQGALANHPVVAPFGLRVRPNPGWALALLAPVAAAALALGLALLVPGTSLVATVEDYARRQAELRGLDAAAVPEIAREVSGLGANPIFFTIAGALSIGGLLFQALMLLPAEVGFRGFLHHVLRSWLGAGPVRVGLWTGLVWGLWLLPRDAVAPGFWDAPVGTALLRLASSLVLGVWLALVRERSGSVFAATLFLAALSRLAIAPQRLVLGADRWLVGDPGLALLVALGLLLGAALAWRRARGIGEEARPEAGADGG